MNAFADAPSVLASAGDLRPVLRLLGGAPGIDASLLLHPAGGEQYEVIEAWPRTGDIGHHIRIDPQQLALPDRDTDDVRLPAAYTIAMSGRPARVLTAPVAGTPMTLVALCARADADVREHVDAAASLLAALAHQGAQSTSERIAEDTIGAIVRNFAVPFVFIDAQGANAFINQGARELLDLAPAEARPQRIARALAEMIGAQENLPLHLEPATDHKFAATFYIDHGARTFKADTRWIADGLRGRICTFHDITEERRMEEELRQLASTDHLTGALNRRAFESRFRAELERARRHSLPLSLIMIDLDHFKSINDTHGHQAGDAVLKEVGNRVLASLRESDVFARLGGEEFGVFLPNTDIQSAMELADRLRRLVSNAPFSVGAEALNVTVSAGVACIQSGDEADDMTKRADDALYAAKQAGRNMVIEAR